MPLKWLPYYEDWDKSLAANKLKKDNGVRKALEDFWKLDADQYEKRLAQLPKLQKLASDFKKAKEVVAAGPDAVKMVGELVEVIPKVRKEVEQQKRDFECSGAHPIDVQFIVVDWNGKPFTYAEGFATFESPGVPKVTKMGKLSSNGFDINDVRLRSTGTVSLMIKGSYLIEGTTDYEFKPGKAVMKFKAIQHSQKYKTRAKSMSEATEKSGFKGSVGVEFKVISVGGEVSKESEYKHGYEDEVEWELEGGLPTFKDFKQI
jgi:hypothetical protein